MKYIIIPILLISFSSLSQESSMLYNESQQLIADTSLQLNKLEFENWRRIEKSLINTVINKLEYSEIAIDNNLQGISIISFEVDSNGHLKNFTRIKSVGGGLEERLEIIIGDFQLLNSLKSDKGKASKYYLSLSFSLIDINAEIEKTGMIPIGGNRYEYIQY